MTHSKLRLNPEVLSALRVLVGFSQAELARRSGLSQGHISELERGDKEPRPATLKKLSQALAVPMSALLTIRSDCTVTSPDEEPSEPASR